KDYGEAEKYYLKSIRCDEEYENTGLTYRCLANLYKEKGDMNKAIKILLEAKIKHPGDVRNLISLGETYIEKGEIDKGYREIEGAIKIEPNNGRALKLMGDICFKKKDYGEAEKYYLKSIRCDEKYENTGLTYHDLAKLYMETKDIKKACKAEKKALKHLPDNLFINDSYNKLNSMRNKN
ncbi:MAG: tetratricopeptide repeat protein, partial [Elusimicrobia bacterium]|nr:tetratricopeptide repeat protein [Candidatus Liberimonas magnetica]